MKSSCGCGCLTLFVLAVLGAGLLWLGSGIFDKPVVEHEVGDAAEGRRGQQKLFELAAGVARRRSEPRTVTVSEREINALLTRHLSGERLPLANAGVRLVGDGVVALTGSVPLHAFFGDSLGGVVGFLPETWAGRPVWLRLQGHVRLETGAARGDRRRLRLDAESLSVGSRRLPTAVLSLMPEGPVRRATRWPVAESIEAVTIEPARVTITTRP